MNCKDCEFYVNGIEGNENYRGCKNPTIIEEHQACCRNLSTGFTSIDVVHAKITHGIWCPEE